MFRATTVMVGTGKDMKRGKGLQLCRVVFHAALASLPAWNVELGEGGKIPSELRGGGREGFGHTTQKNGVGGTCQRR